MKKSAPPKSGRASLFRRSTRFQLFVFCLLAPGLLVWNQPLQANPRGAVVVHGNVKIGAGQGGNLQIRQGSQNAIINWDSFSIKAGELTQFRQRGSNAAVLNRVTGGDPSAIHGALKANGNVFVINPNGILVGAGGVIDVHGLVVSTLDVADGEFLVRGDMVLKGAAGAGVTNLGRINAIGGDVMLIGRTVHNSGSISSQGGRVGLAAGEEVLLKADDGLGGERLFVRASGSGVSGTGIFNDGTIEGAAVELKAHGNLYALAINNKGSIRATGTVNSGGRVYLRGVGGTIENSGTIEAVSPGLGNSASVLIEAAYAKVDGQIKAEGGAVRITGSEKVELGGAVNVSSAAGRGGDVTVEGREIALGGTALVDASGANGGGRVRIGGGFQGLDPELMNADTLTVANGAVILADSVTSGDAGTVALWSDGATEFRGRVSAQAFGSEGNGGLVEVSGKSELSYAGTVSTLSANGRTGTLLLDPENFEIGTTTGTNALSAVDLVTALGTSNIVVSTGNGNIVGETGTIAVNSAVSWNNGNQLSLLAHGDIRFNASVQNAGSGDLVVVAGWDGINGYAAATPGGGASGTLNYANFIANPGWYGNANGTATGSVYVGSGSQTAGIAIGSFAGATHVLGHAVNVLGSDSVAGSYAVIGTLPVAGVSRPGTITVHAKGGGVTVQGGAAANTYGGIGHRSLGGVVSNISGDISVESLAGLALRGGLGQFSSAQIGHGGGSGNLGTISGAIEVKVSDDLAVIAGNGIGDYNGAYAQIGHGGVSSAGVFSGAVTIDGVRDLTLAGGSDQAYAQIGHGGSSGTHGIASSGDPIFAAARSLSAAGAVRVINTTGVISLTGGTGLENAYAQIGHGGVAVSSGGVIGGDVSVEAGSGGVLLQGGLGSTAYSLIGSGGYQIASALSGTVRVDSRGSGTGDGVTLRGGDGNHSYGSPSVKRSGYSGAMIGNGGYSNSSTVTGATYVTIQNGGLAMNAGTGYYSNTTIGHSGVGSGGAMTGLIDLDVVNGDIFLGAESKQLFTLSQIGHGGWDSRNHGGDINVRAQQGDIMILGGNGSSFNYAKIGHGGYGNSSQQIDTGTITVEATLGMVELKSRNGTSAFTQIGHGGMGKGGFMRGEFRDAISVTAGTAVKLGAGNGGDTFAMIGHGGTSVRGVFTGAVNVKAGAEGLLLTGGGSKAFAQVGHGGYNEAAAVGVYTISAAPVTVEAGLVDLKGGATNAYAQIGHGGSYLNGSSGSGSAADSAVVVTTRGTAATDGVTLKGGTGSDSYAMIGSGGRGGALNVLGDVTVTSAGGGISLEGTTTNAFALIGNGGHEVGGALSGTTTVNSNGGGIADGISLRGGSGAYSYANIGHATNNVTGSMLNSDTNVKVLGGGLTMTAGSGNLAAASIGLQSREFTGSRSGKINVNVVSGDLLMTGGIGTTAFAQIGHGGSGQLGVWNMSGEVTVTAGDAVKLVAGSSSDAFAMIGHGGSNVRGVFSGAVNVKAGAEGLLLRGGGSKAFAQVGHGGYNDAGAVGVYTFSAAPVTVEAGLVDLKGGSTNAYAMIGHGGALVNGSSGSGSAADSAVVVTTTGNTATDGVKLRGGTGSDSFAMIGSGGREGSFNVLGDVTVTTAGGRISLEGTATNAFALIGNGGHLVAGALSGTTTVNSNGSGIADGISLKAGGGTYSYANIGHATNNVNGSMLNSDTFVKILGGGLTLTAGSGTLAGASIGLQSRAFFGDRSGKIDVDVVSGNVLMTGGIGTASFAQIGHGGWGQLGVGSMSGDVTLTVDNGTLTMQGGLFSAAADYGKYAMIGHGGGALHTGAMSGSVLVDVKNTISMESGSGGDGFTLIGHGGRSRVGTFGAAGDKVEVTSRTAGLSMANGNGSQAFSMVGMGGSSTTGNKTGNVAVSTVTGVLMNGTVGIGAQAFLQIGHGGYSSGGTTMSGDVSVTGSAANSAVTLRGGTESYNYTMIGHGGGSSATTGGKSGAIAVSAGSGGITLKGGGTNIVGGTVAPVSFAQIGHGGATSAGSANGAINVTTTNGGNVILHGGGKQHTYAQIGHGGRSTATGLQTGAVTVVSDGKVEVKGAVDPDTGISSGIANETFAQIGHGGMFSSATFGGEIKVSAQTGVLLETGASFYNRAQVGHGGYGAGTNAGAAVEMVNANVTVTTVSGGVILDATKANTRGFALAMIGNGGTGLYNADRAGAFLGDIKVDGGTGNVELHSGSSGGSGAIIGNGGTALSGNHSGNIRVSAEGDLIMDLRPNGTNNTFSRIGHGGVGATTAGADLAMSGNMSGDICVHVGGKAMLNATGGNRVNNYVQIGHGGGGVAGDFTGNVTVVARGSGGLTLTGGSGTGAYSQIGHGGRNTAGTMTGHVSVVAETGSIALAGGGPSSYAMLGHGDGAKTSTGQRGGGMHIFAAGNLTGTGGSGAANQGNVYIFHQNNNGLKPADYIVGSGDGYQKVVNGNISLPAYTTVDEGTMITGNLGVGLVQIVDNSATDYTFAAPNMAVDSSADFYLVTGGNITMLASYQNKGSGNVTLVAGWNGVGGTPSAGSVTYASNGMGGFNYCKPTITGGSVNIDFNDCGTFGNAGKTITIGSAAQTSRVSIGSAGGTNTFAAAGIKLLGSNTTAAAATQLGFYSDGTAASGAINLRVKDLGLVLTSGTATNAFTQIGHGGTFSVATGGANAAINISFCAPGDVILNAENPLTQASGAGSYAQIGHGGNGWIGKKIGAVKIDGARNVTLNAGVADAFAQIGHGGAAVGGGYGSGEARGNIEVINTTGKIGLYGGTGLNGTAQIGHGGVEMRGPMSGSVTVEAGAGGLEMLGGNIASRTYAMIGNGGINVDNLINGDVTVTAKGTAAIDGIVMSGGIGTYSGAFIGNGIYQNNAAIAGFTKVSVLNGGIAMSGGGGSYSKVGIGHSNDTDSNSMTGDVEVDVTEGGLSMTGGTGSNASATIGHEKVGGTTTMNGSVDVDVRKGDIALRGGLGGYSYSVIGHAGRSGTSTSSGNVTVIAGDGDITVTGGNSAVGTAFAVARIGHGVWESGNKTGVITVTAEKGDVVVQGGSSIAPGNYNFAQIGHGGYGNGSTQNIVNQAINITANQGSVIVKGGLTDANFAQIGHGGLGRNSFFLGSFGGDITVKAGDAVVLTGGNAGNTHAQIGNGGSGLRGPVSGDVLVEAGIGGITLNGGTGSNSFAAIGNGGNDIDNNVSGSTTVRALGINTATDGIVLKGGTGSQAAAHIGHLHIAGSGTASGAVEVNTVAGFISLEGGGSNAHAQIGHGGRDSDGAKSGNVTVKAAHGVSLSGGGVNAFAQIGHGGLIVKAPLSGNVFVEAGTGGIKLTGSGNFSHALIGNGGYDIDNIITGSTTVRALGTDAATDGIRLKGGNGEQAVAHIGHLNSYSTGSASGAVDVSAAAGDIVVEAGDIGYFAHAQIGHGGRDSDSDKSGAISVTAANGDVIMRAGGNRGSAHYAPAQIGHGGYANGVVNRSYSDDIRVESVTGNVRMTGGDAAYDYAQIGHGGTYATAGMSVSFSGKVDVLAATDVIANAGTADTTYAQIGHGGRSISGTSVSSVGGAVDASAIAVTAGRDVLLSGGLLSYSGAKIGHGHDTQTLASFVENKITVNAGRNVGLVSPQFASYTGTSYSGTQIGHGGTNATVAGGNSGYTGDIILNAGGKLDLIAGKNASTFNYAFVGHTAYFNVRGNHRGDITVNTGTVAGLADYGINIVAGSRDDAAATANSYYSFAGIGHHGHSNGGGGGNLDGNIVVNADRGGLTIKGGVRGGGTGDVRLHAAQIGHGDYNSDGLKSGNIKVCIADDILLENGDSRQSPVQIGHGGFSHDGDVTGSIAVTSREGNIVLNSSVGDAEITYTQIGHGGNTTTGTFDGDISLAAAGDVRLIGGNLNATYAQIGHGGDDATGTFSGKIHLLAGGDFNLTGGANRDGYAMVGHGTASPLTSGIRRGEMKLAVGGNTVLTDNVSGVRLGHGTTTAGGILNSGITLVTGTLDLSNHGRKVGEIANEMGQDGAVTFAVLNGDLLVDGPNVSFNHGYETNFVASGNVTIATSVQNAGSGEVGAASGWASLAGYDPATSQFDGSNGLTLTLDFNNCFLIDTLAFDLSTVAADASLWGNNGRKVSLGGGSQTSTIAFGSAGGATTVLGHAVEVLGSTTTAGSGSLIGALPVSGISPSGAITVLAREGGITLAGGLTGAYAQIGHHALGAIVSALSGDIRVESLGSVAMNGGSGLLSYAQIGHGGNSATLNTIAGKIEVTAADDIVLSGGSSSAAYAQVGHGGIFTSGDISGAIGLKAGGSIRIKGTPANAAYAKVGHGDDVRGAFAVQGGAGTRAGNIEMRAGDDIEVSGGMVGHVNSESSATATGGKVWIGLVDAAGNLLTDPAGGSLIADAASEFAGAEELRFYVPTRANNQVANGAKINGVAYTGGAVTDPWPVQRPDEYTNIRRFSNGAPDQTPGQRTAFGSPSDPAPLASLGYAFYYEMIEIGGTFPPEGNPVIPGGPDDGNGGPDVPVIPDPDYLGMVPDDRAYDDWLREQERRYWGWGDYGIYYEGYPQYGPSGESIYDYRYIHGGVPQ